MTEKPKLTVDQAMRLLGMTKRRQVYDYVRRHHVPNRGLGRALLLDEDDLLRPRAPRAVDVVSLARERAAHDQEVEEAAWRSQH